MNEVRFADHADHVVVNVDDRECADVMLGKKAYRFGNRVVGPHSDDVTDHHIQRFHVSLSLPGYSEQRLVGLQACDDQERDPIKPLTPAHSRESGNPAAGRVCCADDLGLRLRGDERTREHNDFNAIPNYSLL
jgi:hypothetical protein